MNEQIILQITMNSTTASRTKRRSPLASMAIALLACLIAISGNRASAGPFLVEVDGGTTNHQGHVHANEVNSFGFVDEVDATCEDTTPFTCATFADTDFTRTEFTDSMFDGARFSGANLSFVDIVESSFVDAIFLTGAVETNLNDISISRSDFTGALFGDGTSATTLRRAIIRGGTFDDADFRGAVLTDTQFHCINSSAGGGAPVAECPSFVGVDFRDADLSSVRFFQALAGDEFNFSNANLLGANLTDTVIAGLARPCLQTDVGSNTWMCMVWGDSVADPAPTIVDGVTLSDRADLRGSNLRNLIVDRSNFANALIAGTNFSGSNIADTRFDSVNATCLLGGGTTAENALEQDLCDYFADNLIGLADFRDTAIRATSFSDAILSNASFADDPDNTDDDLGADLTDVDFSDSTLEGTDFSDAIFTRVVLDRANLGCDNNPGTNPADFEAKCGNCANFTDVFGSELPAVDGAYNISMQTIEFDDILACSALSEARTPPGDPLIADLSHVRLDGSSFTGVDLADVDFVGASLVGAVMNGAQITGVHFDDADLTLALLNDITSACASGGGGCATFVGADFSFAGMRRGNFASVNFDDAVFDGTVTDSSDFSSATFGDGPDTDADGASFKGAMLNGSKFEGASFTNADLTNATATCLGSVCASFANATFTDSLLLGANFRGANLSGTQFINSNAMDIQSNLSGADFRDTTFDATTSFGMSRVDGLDLAGANLTAADPALFGAVAPPPTEAIGVNLSNTSLRAFDFTNVDLRNWNFNAADITLADFSGANLDGAVLTGIDFEVVFPTLTTDVDFFAGTDLRGADLHPLDLSGKNLSGADLTGARVTRTLFVGADLTHTNLSSLDRICESTNVCAELTGAFLHCANFDGTNPTEFAVGAPSVSSFYQFVDSDLSGIKLRNRSFEGFDLSGLDFTGADLQAANMRGADLTGTVLSGANMSGATFCTTSAPITCATFGATSPPTTLTTLSDPMGALDCNDHEAANLSGVDFGDAPRDLLEGKVTGDSVACVNFTNADLSTDNLALPTIGFDFSDLSDWQGAVLAGANLRFQDFGTTNSGDFFEDFFVQLGHAKDPNDVCTDDDNDVAEIEAGADLQDVIFSCGDLTGQQMSATATPSDLREAQFVRTAIGGTGFSFQGAQLEGANFSNVDFSDPALVGVFQDIETVKVPGTDEAFVDEHDIAYPNLRRTNLAYTNFSSSTPPFQLQHVDLSLVRLEGANLDNVNLTDAILDNILSLCGTQVPSPTNPDPCQPLDNPTATCASINGATLVGASLQGFDFTRSLFDTAGSPKGEFFQAVAGKDLRGVDFTGSAIAGMNFSGMILTDAKISTVQRLCDSSIISGEDGCANFEGAQFGSSNPNEPLSFLTLNPTEQRFDFRGSKLAGASFVNALLVNVNFSSIGDVCVTLLPTPTDCLRITGKNAKLFGSNFSGMDVNLIEFGDPDVDGVLDFDLVNFTLADLSGSIEIIDVMGMDVEVEHLFDMHNRSFSEAVFTGANASLVDFNGATLERSVSGCTGSGTSAVCTNFDRSKMCGVNAANASFAGSFDRVDAYPAGCTERAIFDDARFSATTLATANFSHAFLDGAEFDSSVVFCVSTDCVNLNGASLVRVKMRGVDLDHALPGLFEEIENHDLSGADFTGSDISDKNFAFTVFDFADLSRADLRRSDLRNATFVGTQFALGGQTAGRNCQLATGGSPVDLRGADLRGADFSRARNFQRGCILVDAATLYDHNTQFPSGFDLLNVMMIPEPSRTLLQVSTLLSVVWLLRRRAGHVEANPAA